MSPWQQAYVLYRRLVPEWIEFYRARPEMSVGVLQDIARHGWEEIDGRLHRHLPRPAGGLRDGLRELAALFAATGDRWLRRVPLGSEEPLDDVYHAACYLAFNDYPWQAPRSAYRGQRRPWRVQPSLFVARPPAAELTAGEFAARVARLGRFVAALEQAGDVGCALAGPAARVAAAQHHGLPTWLVDVSADPFVALFFASRHGAPGDIGVLMRFSLGEWEDFSAGGTNRVGALQPVAAPGLRRLQAQRAFFLEGSHPEIVEQYLAFKLCFHQQPGLVFEDASLGVTAARLLDLAGDPLAAFVGEFLRTDRPDASAPAPAPLPRQPPREAMLPLTAADYRAIAASWLQGSLAPLLAGRAWDGGTEAVLLRLCEFHRRLQVHHLELGVVTRGLRRFNWAVGRFAAHVSLGRHDRLSLASLVASNYLSHAAPAEVPLVRALQQEAEAWSP